MITISAFAVMIVGYLIERSLNRKHNKKMREWEYRNKSIEHAMRSTENYDPKDVHRLSKEYYEFISMGDKKATK